MPTTTQFLLPVLALIAWTLVMWFWLYATRLPAMKRAGIDPQEAAHPGTYAHRMPEHARSVADNYNHLHEQPTIFYALCVYTYLVGPADNLSTGLAWAYVGIRIVHTLIQVTTNYVPLRFAVFNIGSLMLIILAARNILALFGIM